MPPEPFGHEEPFVFRQECDTAVAVAIGRRPNETPHAASSAQNIISNNRATNRYGIEQLE